MLQCSDGSACGALDVLLLLHRVLEDKRIGVVMGCLTSVVGGQWL